ncbi:unnamed protein product [Ixodes hexagonus]
MEDPLHVLVRNRKFTLLISDLAQSFQKVLPNAEPCSANLKQTDEVVNSLVKILDVAASYEGETARPEVDQLKHKLKVAIAELRNGHFEVRHKSALLSQALSDSIQLLIALEKLERTSIEKAHLVAIQQIRALESLDATQEGDVVPLLLNALRNVLPFLLAVQARTSSLSERSLYERLFDISAIQRFYLQFLADTFRLFAAHFNSRYMKILWYFCICQACQWLSKLCCTACGTSSQHALDGWMGAFVEKVDEALYRLSREVDGAFFSAVDFVVGHGMSVGQLCEEDSREKLHVVCKELLQVKINLKNAMDQAPRNKFDGLKSQMKASLENFEEVVNIALVELLVENYMKPSSYFGKLLETARQCPKDEANTSSVNKSDLLVSELNSFCSALDLTYSIAHLAAGCTTDVRCILHMFNNLNLMPHNEKYGHHLSLLAGAIDPATYVQLLQLEFWHTFLQVKFLTTSSLSIISTDRFEISNVLFFRPQRELTALIFPADDVAAHVEVLADDHSSQWHNRLEIPENVIANRTHGCEMENIFTSVARQRSGKQTSGHITAAEEGEGKHSLRVFSIVTGLISGHLITGITTINATANAKGDAAGDKTSLCNHAETSRLDLDVTALLEGMQSTRVDETKLSIPSATLSGTPGCCAPELSFRQVALHRNMPEILRKINANSCLATTASDTGWKRALERSLWVSNRNSFMAASSGDSWIQNNSAIHALVGEIEAVVAELCSDSAALESKKEVAAAAERLSQAGARLSDEIVAICSHLDPIRENHKLCAKVEKAQREINFTARQLHLFTVLDGGSSANNIGVSPLARNLLLLATEASKMLSMLCIQHCNRSTSSKDAQISLSPCPSHSASAIQNGSSSSA